MPSIQPLLVQGDFKINTSDVQINDFSFYDLSVEYEIKPPKGKSKPMADHFHWNTKTSNDIINNTIHFSFIPFNSNFIVGNIIVSVKGYDSTLLWREEFAVGNKMLQNLKIVVDFKKPEILRGTDQSTVPENSKKLHGKVLELPEKCILKGLTVLLQAKKAGDTIWRTVGLATTDGSGNFSMQYPYGIYVAAQAIVSLTPDSPVDIEIKNDPSHTSLNQTIADNFLYLLLTDVDCTSKSKEEDCDCKNPNKPLRLPGHEELINSDDYTQDIGGSCVNLSTPNRTLNEYSQIAAVRFTDPDMATYVLNKITNKDPVTKKDKVTFILKPTSYTPILRKIVDLSNPIYWQDAPDNQENLSIYQAVTVATGHILHYKVVVKSDGYSLGELLYSLPLAPGQNKEIVIMSNLHTLKGAETQQISQRESLAASLVNDITIADTLSGEIGESTKGRSSATTGGVSGGFGLGAILDSVGISLGVAGGVANANSAASQNSSRSIAESFAEKLRNSITQNAQSYRELNASVITTVQEGQQYGVTSEVVANHNHCHSLTMMYFEVLRHYAIYQELSSVEECLFIPLLMTNFTIENIYKWRDVLAAHLLPMPSDTYLQPFNEVRLGLNNPVRKAFDALERVRNNWSNVNFPPGAFDEEVITSITGEIYIRTNLIRPKSRYDRIKTLPKGVFVEDFSNGLREYLAFGNDVQLDQYISIDNNFSSVAPKDCIRVIKFDEDFFEQDIINKNLWQAYATLLNFTEFNGVFHMLGTYFLGRLISEWDAIFNDEIAPALFDRIVNTLKFDLPGINGGVDFSCDIKYKGGDQIMKVSLNGTWLNKTRKEILHFYFNNTVFINDNLLQHAAELITLVVRNINISYSTAHYNGVLFNGFVNNDLIDGMDILTPEKESERRNPKQEDRFLTDKLVENLNINLIYYNIVLFRNLPPDSLYMLLDGFGIQTYDDYGQPSELRSLASVVKNEVIGIAGNSLVMPVAPGYKIDRTYIITPYIEGPVQQINLFDHYKPLTPAQPYRISIPTKGVYAEAVMGECDACEKEKEKTSQDWTKFTTDQPTAINPITTPVPTITDWKAAFKDFATPVVNIQNAPTAPAPGAGLAGLPELLGKSGIFKDITGLDANQQNALQTYLSNQENAKAFAEMAKELAMQGHNTEHSDKITDSIRNSPELSNEEKAALMKDHLQQQIDGGQSKKAEQQNQQNAKPSLTDAAVKAVDQGKAVKATSADPDGKTETIDISAASGGENELAVIPRDYDLITGLNLKQTLKNDCWAVAATIMKSWDAGGKLDVNDVLAEANDGGDKYLKIYTDDHGLPALEKEGFISKLGMVSEPPASYPLSQFITWVKTNGPLWVTVDADETGKFSPHAQILIKINGTGTEDGIGTDFIFIDTQTGGIMEPQPYNDFLKQYGQVAIDNHSPNLFPQIVHFREVGEGRSGLKEGPIPEFAKFPLGFDISHGQTDHTHFSDIAIAGKVFGFAKVTHGSGPALAGTTHWFPYQWSKMKAFSIIRGAYHWLTGINIESQKNALLKYLPRILPGDLAPALDVEDDDLKPIDNSDLLSRIKYWMESVEAALGRPPIIYTGLEKWRLLVNSDALKDYPLWTAHAKKIEVSPGKKEWQAQLVDGWVDWTICQYAWEGGYFLGIPYYVEKGIKEGKQMIDFDAYNGTIYELRGFADMGRPAVALLSTTGSAPQPYISYCNSDNTLHLTNGPDFNETTLPDSDDSVGPPPSCCDPVAIVSSDKVYLYYRRLQSIGEWVSDAPNSSQKIDTISVPPIHDPRAIAYENKRYVVYWGVDDDWDDWYLLTWNGSWSPPESLLDHAGPSESQGISTGQPALYLIEGKLHVVGRVGHDGHLFDLMKDSSGTWKSEDITASSVSDDTLHSLLPGATYSPCIFETTDGVFIVFRAVGGQLWIINQSTKIATNLFSHLSTVTPLCSGHPTCFVINNIPHIVFRGADKFIYEIFPNSDVMLSSIWNTSKISGLTKAAAEPVAVTSEGIAIVSFRSADGAIIVMKYDGTPWEILKQ